MGNPDSFIEEVTEEVRRDRLFRLLRRYGWIAITLVVLLVAGAAFNEWNKARQQAAAEEFGDSVLAALERESPEARRAALADIEAEGTTSVVPALLAAGETAGNAGQLADELRGLAENEELPQVYRDLAAMKLALLDGAGLGPQERIALLEPLTAGGRPFRLLAQEQIALAQVELGDADSAIARARDVMADSEVTQDLRRRMSQLIVALGASLEQA